MDIKINGATSPNFRALYLSSYRKCRRDIGDFSRSDYKRLEDSLSDYAKDVDIYVSPSQNTVSSGFDVEIKKLGAKCHSGSIKFNIQRSNTVGNLVEEAVINTQRIIKEYMNHDFSGSIYVPNKGDLPEAIDKAIPRLKKFNEGAMKHINIFILPGGNAPLEPSWPNYYVYVQKPGLGNFDVKKQHNSDAKSSDTLIKPIDFSSMPHSLVGRHDSYSADSMADDIVKQVASLWYKSL